MKLMAQGDLLVMEVGEIPGEAKEKPHDGRLVLAHSETGHHHAIDDTGVIQFETTDPLVCYLRVDGEFADIIHHRSYDTHATIRLDGHGAKYEVRRQREWSPQGWQKVMD